MALSHRTAVLLLRLCIQQTAISVQALAIISARVPAALTAMAIAVIVGIPGVVNRKIITALWFHPDHRAF